MKQKVIRILLCMMLCMAFVPVTVSADTAKAAPSGIWTDFAADAFAGGSGTAGDPYQIATAEQLAKLAADVNSGAGDKTHSGEYFVLTKDIDLSEHVWTPLGYESYASGSAQSFQGHFDGNGYKVTGLYVDERGKNRSAGLFGCVTASDGEPIIQNLTVENGTVYAGDNTNDEEVQYGAGLLIGNITILGGGSVTGTFVKNCSVSGMVDSNMYAGGLIGSANYTQISDCRAEVEVNGWCVAGGFVGYAFEAKMENCVAIGEVESKGWSTGGFAGFMSSDSQADRCAAYGKVTASDWNCGGFAGYIEENVTIENCVAFGDVESKVGKWNPKVGGFAGTVNGSTIKTSHAAGKITSVSSTYQAGGFAGVNENGSFSWNSFDVEKNAGLKALGGQTASDLEGVEAASTQKVKANVCQDFEKKHELEPVEGKAATCTDDGWKPYYKCEACGSLYSDKELRTMIDEPEVIKANGHKFGEWHITKKATATEKGEKERICEVCQFVEKAEIPATGAAGNTDPAQGKADQSAETGDSSHIGLLIALLAASAMGIAATVIVKKRRTLM